MLFVVAVCVGFIRVVCCLCLVYVCVWERVLVRGVGGVRVLRVYAVCVDVSCVHGVFCSMCMWLVVRVLCVCGVLFLVCEAMVCCGAKALVLVFVFDV